MPGVLSRVMRWCVHVTVHIWDVTVGMEEVWFLVVGVGKMLSVVVPIFLLFVLIILHGVLGRLVFLF